jgi:exopolyphosphatase/guanosine-5'-triphosphate,3'-diphosphate pyrophosphatase
MRLAAIDLGTVTSRLLIADVDSAGIHELERSMRITHLGEGLSATGTISSAAIEREVTACTDFLATIAATDGGPVEQIDAVATSAMRDASNSKVVLTALREAGLEVTVIAGEREAQLSFLGTLSGFANPSLSFCALVDSPVGCQGSSEPANATSGVAVKTVTKQHHICKAQNPRGGHADQDLVVQQNHGSSSSAPVLTVDVGGGSTEVILGTLTGKPPTPQIHKERSFNIGSRRITDRFLPTDPPSKEELHQAKTWIYDEMQAYFASFETKPAVMIAVAGTATTAVTVRDAMVEYDPWKVHGAVVTTEELDRVLRKLAALDLEQRKQTIGLEPGRASVIVGGLLVLQSVLQLAGLPAFTVSETDILHGILLNAYSS